MSIFELDDLDHKLEELLVKIPDQLVIVHPSEYLRIMQTLTKDFGPYSEKAISFANRKVISSTEVSPGTIIFVQILTQGSLHGC